MQDDPDGQHIDSKQGESGLLNDIASFLCLTMFVLILAAVIFLMFYNVSITVDTGGVCPISRN